MGPLGWQETVFIFLLALLIFGPKKLPELGRNIGKALTEFRRASSELRATFDREMANIERETGGIKEEANKLTGDLYNSYYDNPHEHQKYPGHEDYGYNYDGYSYPDYTPDEVTSSNEEGTQLADGSATAESATANGESTIAEGFTIAPAEGTVAVGSEEAPAVVSTAESATEKAKDQQA
ncbi:MAG: twin-arginine translocase TatA/TatE family subunit [Bryobacter sp.]|nr:twin-arginine translocase TatA/TatE family subunit [Bryobacter sp.]